MKHIPNTISEFIVIWCEKMDDLEAALAASKRRKKKKKKKAARAARKKGGKS